MERVVSAGGVKLGFFGRGNGFLMGGGFTIMNVRWEVKRWIVEYQTEPHPP